jgi:hypothetical protein
LAFNPGVKYEVVSLTPEEDFTAGEIDLPNKLAIDHHTGGLVNGAQLHILSYLGETWGKGKPRFTPEEAVAYSRKVWALGGAITWDVPVTRDGKLPPAFLPLLNAIGEAAAASAR